ncbi:hypothetical protein [Paraflavitalea speifideaquila]|uniref:hypothetical protein n=1 Tax=Paraflavitalea speifideaquila TaxID=3076558 RepID=UPI0028EAD8FE|nr:hypothetical protein [Paraflavitalea speifideiaquila]
MKNETDHSLTFAYIIKVYRDREPRDFNDARGFVINDYQASLEDKWIAELKKKYPLKINEAVVKTLPIKINILDAVPAYPEKKKVGCY